MTAVDPNPFVRRAAPFAIFESPAVTRIDDTHSDVLGADVSGAEIARAEIARAEPLGAYLRGDWR